MRKFAQVLYFGIVLAAWMLHPAQAHAQYKYANAEGEYLIELPDAPTGETIWAQEGNVPFIENPPKYGAVGEIATVKRIDPDTGDVFDVRITFVKASRDFLLTLKEENIKNELMAIFSDVNLENTKFSFSQGNDTLKWGVFSGFSVSQNNDILYNIAHYLVGVDSIMVVKATYSVQNEVFNQYYKALAKSITYMGR